MKPKLSYLFLLLSIFLIFAGIDSHAEVVPVANPSFEVDVPEDGGWILNGEYGYNIGVITSWEISGVAGTWRPSNDHYSDGVPDGWNVAYAQDDSTIFQILLETLKEGHTYILRVFVGKRTTMDMQAYTVQLLAGGALLSEDNNLLTPAEGRFAVSTITYNAQQDDPNIGQPLEIRMSHAGVGQVGFDNVSLEVVPVDLNSGLVAYYPFDGNANDESGNYNHGLEHNGVGYTPGVIGQAASFDGIDDYVRLPSSIRIQYPLSISLWVKVSEQTPYRTFISAANNVAVGAGYDNEFYFYIYTLNNPYTENPASFTSMVEIWHHVVWLYDGAMLKAFVNGHEALSVQRTGSLRYGPYDDYTIGSYCADVPCGHQSPFQGLVDEVRIYNHALTEAEIQILYSLAGLVDADGDGIPDEQDNCPTDPVKTEPGICGCGVSDIDTDTDGTPDCNDADDDDDGMPDAYEDQYPELDPLVNDAHADSDGDSFTNIVEYHSGTNPTEASSVPPTNLKDGLVAFYPFNGNAYDESGHGNHGDSHGDPSLVEDRFGNVDSAYYFDGIEDSIEVPGNYFDSQSFVVWFKMDEILESRFFGLFERMNQFVSDNFQGYRLRFESDGLLYWNALLSG